MCSRPSSRLELDEHAEVGDLGHLAVDDHARLGTRRGWPEPRILGELLDAEADALLLLVDLEHDALDLVALLETSRWGS
jgi:hypothetical protein